MKIAVVGSHGVGKTTFLAELFLRCKIQYPDQTVGIVQETASECPFPINFESTEQSQLWIFTEQIRRELEQQQRYDIVICDRSVFDPVAYCFAYGMGTLAGRMLPLAERMRDTYDVIHFLRAKADTPLHADGRREASSREFRAKVEEKLWEILSRQKEFGALFRLEER